MTTTAARTKKVTTYGKKKTQIISIHSDFSDHSPAATSKTSFVPSPSPISPVRALSKRLPLHSKPSHHASRITNVPRLSVSPPPKPAKPGKKLAHDPSAFSTPAKSPSPLRYVSSSPESEIIIKRPTRSRRARRIVVRSPSTASEETSRSIVEPEDSLRSITILDSPAPSSVLRTHTEDSLRSITLPSTPVPAPQQPSRTIQKQVFDGVVISGRKNRIISASSLADEFAKITIDLTESDDSFTTAQEVSSIVPLEDLLQVCSFPRVCPFTGFFSSATFANLLPGARPDPSVQKIGEATYSEVFGVDCGEEMNVVVKVVPLESEALSTAGERVKLPDCSSIGDVLREIETTRHMTGLKGGGFVEFLGAYIVRGAYPAPLLAEWDQFDRDMGSESIRPGGFSTSQRFALIVLGDGGPDLEAFKFDKRHGWIQAAAIFWQVSNSLARAEEWAKFEHRDLHEGQVLIHATNPAEGDGEVDYLSSITTGIKATIIDFGLSRLDFASKGPVWSTMPAEVFEGVGNQWDVYRKMRERVDDWREHHPITNVLWLRYLLQYLLHSKGLRKPRPKSVRSQVATAPLQPTKRIPSGQRSRTASSNAKPPPNSKDSIEVAYEMLCDLEVVLGSKTKKGKSKNADEGMLGSAEDLVKLGRRRGWLL